MRAAGFLAAGSALAGAFSAAAALTSGFTSVWAGAFTVLGAAFLAAGFTGFFSAVCAAALAAGLAAVSAVLAAAFFTGAPLAAVFLAAGALGVLTDFSSAFSTVFFSAFTALLGLAATCSTFIFFCGVTLYFSARSFTASLKKSFTASSGASPIFSMAARKPVSSFSESSIFVLILIMAMNLLLIPAELQHKTDCLRRLTVVRSKMRHAHRASIKSLSQPAARLKVSMRIENRFAHSATSFREREVMNNQKISSKSQQKKTGADLCGRSCAGRQLQRLRKKPSIAMLTRRQSFKLWSPHFVFFSPLRHQKGSS